MADPTPDEIEAACVEIRAGWTEAEHYSRWRGRSDSSHSTEGVEQVARLQVEQRLQTERLRNA